jgi:anti-sigma factor RsiW
MKNQTNHPDLDQFQALIDQVLEKSAALAIQDHLDGCPACREELARLNLLITRLENLPEFSLTKDLSSIVLVKLRENKKVTSGLTWALVIEALAAGAVIGALIPTIQAASWLPQVINTPQKILAAVNIFLTQLASSWLVWWAQLQLNLKVFLDPTRIQFNLPAALPPWILILAAGVLGIFVNFFLLRINPIQDNNH